jgi:UDP-glucuronate 4-epimerase
LLDFIAAIERASGCMAQRNDLPTQKGDVPGTFASCDVLETLTGYRPGTSVDNGVATFVEWYRPRMVTP